MSKYFYRIYGVKFGPVSLELLQNEIASGQLSGAEVRLEDEDRWTPIAEFIAQRVSHHSPTTHATPSIPVSESDVVTAQTLWYVRMGRAEHGPMELQKLIEMVTAGRILPMDRVRQSHQTEWTNAQAIPALFSPNSDSLTGVSSFVSSPTRSSPAKSTGSVQREHITQGVHIPQVTSAPVHNIPDPSFQPAAPVEADPSAMDSTRSQPLLPQTRIGGSVLAAELTPPASRLRSPTHPEVGRNDGVNQSPKPPKSGPYPKFKGESKPKTERDKTEGFLPSGLWNWIIAAAGCVLIIGIGRSLIPADVGQFEFPLGELSAAYQALDKERSENPDGEVRALATKDFVDKVGSVKQSVSNLSTDHPIRLILLTLSDNLIWAAKSETSEELTTYMEVSSNLLNFATKEMQKWKDELLKKGSKTSLK
jgi:GYF domain 2